MNLKQPVTEIFKGIWPFVITELLVLALLVMAPELALWLPTLIYGYLERFHPRLDQFDGMDFSFWREEYHSAMPWHRARISTLPGRKRHPSQKGKVLSKLTKLKPFELGPLHADSVAHGLAVPAPRRRTRLASAQITGAQSIQFRMETL